MDTRDTEANAAQVEAQVHVRQAERMLEEAFANVVQQDTQQKLAAQEFDRTKTLFERGYANAELLDHPQQVLDGANAALNAATARVGEADHAFAAEMQDVTYNKIVVDDGVLAATRDAWVQYGVVNTGEVIGTDARIFTLLDLSKVYMAVFYFLPTEDESKSGLDG